MEVNELQKLSNEIVEEIDNKLSVNHNANNTTLHILEEIGEIARQINNPTFRNKEINKENLSEELADVLILIIRLANIHNIDIEEAILKNIEKLKQRHNIET